MTNPERLSVDERWRAPTSETAAEEVQREQWAALMLATVQRELPTLGTTRPEPPRGGSEASAAKSGDARLTPSGEKLDGTAANAAVADGAGEGDGQLNRLEFEVEAGALGKVALGLQRTAGAIQVVIGLEDSRQVALFDLERAALTASLKAAGLNIASLTVTYRKAVGTTLALPRSGMIARRQVAATSAYRGSDVPQTDTEEGLNLVG